MEQNWKKPRAPDQHKDPSSPKTTEYIQTRKELPSILLQLLRSTNLNILLEDKNSIQKGHLKASLDIVVIKLNLFLKKMEGAGGKHFDIEAEGSKLTIKDSLLQAITSAVGNEGSVPERISFLDVTLEIYTRSDLSVSKKDGIRKRFEEYHLIKKASL